MWHWGYGSWWMGLMMFLVWAAVIAGIIWAIRSTGQRPQSEGPRRRPLDILAARYARGEIDEEEFTRRRQRLEDADL